MCLHRKTMASMLSWFVSSSEAGRWPASVTENHPLCAGEVASTTQILCLFTAFYPPCTCTFKCTINQGITNRIIFSFGSKKKSSAHSEIIKYNYSSNPVLSDCSCTGCFKYAWMFLLILFFFHFFLCGAL